MTPSRLARLIGVLEQMLQCVRSRTPLSASVGTDNAVHPVDIQRQHIEWLCDHDMRSFRVYTRQDVQDTQIMALSSIPSSICWGQEDRHRDTLYHGTQPFVFYVPASVGYIVFEETNGGLYNFVLELSPIALRDVLALDVLCHFINPVDCNFPRSIVICTMFPRDVDLTIPDISLGTAIGTVRWSDVAINDYLLVELSVTRIFDVTGTWSMCYRLLGATRLATHS